MESLSTPVECLSFSKQIEHLKQMGLEIEDPEYAAVILAQTGYHRLSGYWHILLDKGNSANFKAGSSFNQIVDIAVFDAQLRAAVFKWIEGVEILLRTKIFKEMYD